MKGIEMRTQCGTILVAACVFAASAVEVTIDHSPVRDLRRLGKARL